MRARRLAFRVASVWVILAGALLLFPGLGDVVFDLDLTNWGLASEYGALLLALGAMYWVFSTDPDRYAPIIPVIALGLLLNVIVNVYWWSVGEYSTQAAVVNVVLGTGMAAWFWTVRPRASHATSTSTT